ncbi:MAG: hypothetical protein AAGF85_00605 [Bacteroidota bacterium]
MIAPVAAASRRNFKRSPSGILYEDMPVRTSSLPTDENLLDLATNGETIENSDLNGKKVQLVPANWANRLRLNGVNGSLNDHLIVKAQDDSGYSIVGGDTVAAGQQVLGTLNSPNYITYEGLHLKGNSNPAIAGITGTSAWPDALGSYWVWRDIVSEAMSFANMQANFSTGVNSSNFYQSLLIEFFRSFGHNIEGENFYVGDTDKADGTYSMIANAIMRHCLGYDKGRDGIQFNHVTNALIEYCTIHNVGQENIGGQNLCFQFHNGTGIVRNNIFHDSPELMNIFSHDVLFENNFWRHTSSVGAYIGRLANSYGANAENLNNQPLIWRNEIFDCAVTTPNLFNIWEDQCDIILEDCYFSDLIQNIFVDNRVDKLSYNIQVINPTFYPAGSIPLPAYVSLNPDDYTTHGLNTIPFHSSRGYRAKLAA